MNSTSSSEAAKGYVSQCAEPLTNVYLFFVARRLIHMPDLLERRPLDRELYHSVYDRGDDEEVGAAG